jgi:chromosome segregation ATPase
MVVLNYDALFKPKPEIKAEFTSVEFDADDTSYSPAETHSMNQLSKELAALKEKLLERENELDSRESAIAMDLEALEKQKKEMNQIQEDLSARLADFEARQGQDLSEEKLKEYKDTSKRWVEMGPEVASIEIQNWRQKRRFEEALSIFELLKSEDKAPIISFMLNSDDDSLIELADALAMRDRGLLPSLDLDDLAPVGIPAN